MREIKYKAVDKITNRLFQVQELSFRGVHNSIDTCYTSGADFTSDAELANLDDMILLEYTNYRDSLGIEIYEGMVIYDTNFDTDINNRVVIFENGAFYGKLVRNGYSKLLSELDLAGSWKVIGNIYTNPELSSHYI